MFVRILFSLFSLLSLASNIVGDYAPSLCDTSDAMRLVTIAAPWSARQEAGGAYLSRPFTFTPKGASSPVTWPAGTIAIFGGQAAFNDVWISSDNANSWTLLSGISRYVEGAYNTAANLVDGTRTASCQHEDGTIFLVAGTFGTKSSRIHTGNLTHWQTLPTAPFPTRERAACLVDSDKNVYVFGGNRQIAPAASLNDIWFGQNGQNWQRITAAAAWPVREGQNMGIMKTTDLNMSPTGEIMIMSSGLYIQNTSLTATSSYRMNDIWASVDRARTWQLINPSADFFRRQDGNLAVSAQGILVVTAGDCGSECNLNDVWASMDGGYTWGQCCNHCGYNNREDQVTLFDRDGYFILMSGAQTFPDNGLAQDVWRSSFSFNDLNAVSTNCKIPIPACGVGLKCIPGGYCPCKPRHGKGVVMDIVDIAPWAEGRQEAGMAARTRPLTFMDVSVTPPVSRTFATSIILFGGKLGSTYYNDVWASSDNGNAWSLISGVYNRTTAGNGNYLRDNSRSADCYDSNGRMYLIGGTNVTTADFSSSVWASDDGIDWAPMTLNAPFWPREASMCSCDHNNNVYVFGGSVKIYTRNNDVWKSSDGGRNWVQQTERAPWPARTQHDSTSYHQTTWNKSILYVLNGIYNSDPAADRNNDIWASSDEGVNWILINKSPQYSSRQDSQTDATASGVLILTGGDQGTNVPGNVNDIWASLDGGYNWGICNSSAGYTPREDQSTGFTPEGYMILTGGDAPWVTRDHNVFRSNGSFNNISYVAESCGLTIPYCGVGLNCWPSATQQCEFGCPARSAPLRSSSSSTGLFRASSSSSAAGTNPTPAVTSSSSPVINRGVSSSTGGSSQPPVSTLVGCSSTSVPPTGSIIVSVIIESSVNQLYSAQGSQFGPKLITAMTNTVRSAHPNIQSSMFQCAQVVDLPPAASANLHAMAGERSEATVYILGSSGSNPSASNVYSTLQSNSGTLNNEVKSNLGVTGSSLNAPTSMGQTVTQTETESGRTSVGLTVGMAFLGLGVGIMLALCLSFLLCGHRYNKDDTAKPVHRSMEPSSNNPNHEMELSHVDKHETYA